MQTLLSYEDFKCSFCDTKQICTEEGLSFVPMIFEAVGGGLGAQAAKVIAELAKNIASASGESASTCAIQMLQQLSVILHRENARAVLRRRSGHA